MGIDFQAIRNHSWAKVRRAGLCDNDDLPLLDATHQLRPMGEIVDRLLAMYVGVASAFGFDRRAGLAWAHREGVADALSVDERRLLAGDEGLSIQASVQMEVDGLYALSWCLSVVDDLDMTGNMPRDLVHRFPELKIDQRSDEFQRRLICRSTPAVLEKLDEAYCFHWAAYDAMMSLRKNIGERILLAVTERRRALEWVMSNQAWEEVTLDT